MLRTAGTFALVMLAALAEAPATASPVFMGLGEMPAGTLAAYAKDVSADGRVVVGETRSRQGGRAFRWTLETGLQDLGPGEANGISADGSVIVGAYASTSGFEAFRWTTEGGMQLLGDIPGGRHFSVANAVSADGSVVVGEGDSGAVAHVIVDGELMEFRSFGEAFRWSAESGMQPLGIVAPDVYGYYDYGSFATGISADGSVIVGGGTVGEAGDPSRFDSGLIWVGDSGPLAPPVGNCCEVVFRGISPDGSTIAGGVWDAGGGEGFWAIRLPDGSVVNGGFIPSGSNANIWDVSLGGEVFVGGFTQNDADAFVLLNGGADFYLMEDYISSVLGLEITGWDLIDAHAVSWDGRTIVGSGINPNGQPEAWILVVPEPSAAALLTLGFSILAFTRRRARQRGARAAID